MMRTGRMQAGAALLVGLLGAGAPAAATERGPLAALDKARDVAADASARAAAVDRETARAAAVDRETEHTVAAEGTAEEVGASPAAAPAAAPHGGARTQATARYDPAKHRDPFQPPSVASVSEDSPRTPLERYEVGQLKLVGVVWGDRASRAMVEDSAGLGYIVFPGTPIGSSGGFVREIEPRRVLIEETVTNFYGEEEAREVVMELPQEDESP